MSVAEGWLTEGAASRVDTGALFDDVVFGGVAEAEHAVDPERIAQRRRVVAIAFAVAGVLLVVVLASAYGISFLHGLSDGLSPK